MTKSNRLVEIGINERIKLEWLEYTANLVLAGLDKHSIDISLEELLRERLSVGSHAQRGSRGKTISILKKIWVRAPAEVEFLRKGGLVLFNHLTTQEHIILHWGMSIAAYPFIGMVAESVGRLLRLQGTASASQVQRRLKEKYGERETVSRATRHVLRNFVEWGVLREGLSLGVYETGQVRSVTEPGVVAWLIESVLSINEDDSSSLKMVLESPILFPFKVASVHSNLLEKHGRIQVIHHGLNEQFVILKQK
ncbi:MAG: hypothetical protein PHI12_02540 [Dehalococcoidales bacterium]|nr:hypothetical protein [Dehalococcoidales bacterium]